MSLSRTPRQAWLWLAAACCLALVARAELPAPAALAAEVAALAPGEAPRYPGSPANLALAEAVAHRFAGSGLAHGAVTFAAPVFRPQAATLSLGGELFTVAAMHPSLARPGNFPTPNATVRLVYVGRNSWDDLKRLDGVPLRDAVAVFDYDCGERWLRLLREGIAGCLFLDDGASTSWLEAQHKVYTTEVAVPRYYLGGEAAARLRRLVTAEAGGASAVLAAPPSRWERVALRCPWAFIPGRAGSLQQRVIVVMAPLDANSVVPELATGAQDLVSLHLLLELFETWRRNPPAHSVLLIAINAHTQGFRGEREVAWHLLIPRAKAELARGFLADEIREQEMFLRQYRQFDFSQPAAVQRDVVRLRTQVDDSTGRRITVKEPIVALARRDVNETKGALVRLQHQKLGEAARAAQALALDEQLKQRVQVLTLFNRMGQQSDYTQFEEGGEAQRLFQGYVAELVGRYRQWAELNRAELEMSRANEDVRNVLAGRRVALVLKLSLSWADDRVGLSSQTALPWCHRFGLNSARLAAAEEQALGLAPGSVFHDTLTRIGGLLEEHYYRDMDTGLDHLQAGIGTPALAFRNLQTTEGLAFTPHDRLERLPWDRVARQHGLLQGLMQRIADDPLITTAAELPNAGGTALVRAWGCRLRTFRFDPFSASVLPQLPVAETMILTHEMELVPARERIAIVDGSVSNVIMNLSDARASELVVGLSYNDYQTDAFHYDPTFTQVDQVIDAGDVHDRANTNLTKSDTAKTLALFRGREVVIRDREDPAAIGDTEITVDSYTVLDARQNAVPRRYGLAGIKSLSRKRMFPGPGPAAVYVDEELEVKLLAQSQRMVIGADAEAPLGRGLAAAEPMPSDWFRLATEDLTLLNEYRLKRMAGVTNQLATEFTRLGAEGLAQARTAAAEHQHTTYRQKLAEALGAQAKAYAQIAGMTNDMLKAVVFYVALLLPFCFFVQKLCFRFVKVEAQMAAFAVLFVACFVLFRFIHPAFRVAQAAEAIFIAFLMLSLGLFVTFTLHRRFEGEMQLLFQSYLGLSPDVGYSTVGQKALLIGVNNMKRRRIRTALTTATIILITFAMLAFSSVSQKASPTMIAKSMTPPYNGLFFQWPGYLQMDEGTLAGLETLFRPMAERLVVRRWLKSKHTLETQAPDGRRLRVTAILGLGEGDRTLLAPQGFPLRPGGRWFSSPTAMEVILPLRLATAMGLGDEQVGQVQVQFRGQPFDLVGLVDDAALAELRDLNHWRIVPVQDTGNLGWGESDRDAAKRVDLSGDEQGSLQFADTGSLMVMPEGTVGRLGGAPFSLSIVLPPTAPIWPAVDLFLTATTAKFFVSSPRDFPVGDGQATVRAGVYYVGSGYKTSIGGLSRLLIPLIIAGTIILNTMLGSVYERKYEIAVYNAIGLNPTHIGLFFLAEAFVYSVIGSVGGYLIGQLLAMTLIKFDLVAGLNLNFSSLIVVYVILFTIAIVLLSTLYPAYAATRAAVPSGKRRWALPPHDGGRMDVVFPFIYQANLAVGVLGYLHQYFQRFSEASLGELIARLDARRQEPDAAGRPSYLLTYDVALAPYDLGVTQTVECRLAYDEQVQSYRLRMTISRDSGQDSNWVTTNRPFLERLRKYLLQWRGMTPAQHAVYVAQADELFTPATKS